MSHSSRCAANQTMIILAGALEMLWSAHETSWSSRVTDGSIVPIDERLAVLEDHRQVIDAIDDGDARRAYDLAAAHLIDAQHYPAHRASSIPRCCATGRALRRDPPLTALLFSYDLVMGVDAAAVTSAEAAQYRAAGWWSDTTLSGCVRRNAASTPDKPAYVDFTLDSADCRFDLVRVRPSRHQPRPAICAARCRTRRPASAVWHKDSAAIHIAAGRHRTLRRCCQSGWDARAGVREVAAILRTTQPTVSSARHRAPQLAATESRPVAARGRRLATTSTSTRTPRRGHAKQPLARRPRRRLSDQLHIGHHRTTEMRCAHPEPVALLPPEGRRQRRAQRRRRVPSRHPHALSASGSGPPTPRRSIWARRPSESSGSIPRRPARRSNATR